VKSEIDLAQAKFYQGRKKGMSVKYAVETLRQKILKHRTAMRKSLYSKYYKERLVNQISELESAIEILNCAQKKIGSGSGG